jgi:hypothetical protein
MPSGAGGVRGVVQVFIVAASFGDSARPPPPDRLHAGRSEQRGGFDASIPGGEPASRQTAIRENPVDLLHSRRNSPRRPIDGGDRIRESALQDLP